MKKIIIIFTAVILVACGTAGSSDDFLETGPVTAAIRTTPFSKGVNFSGWFESYSAHEIPFTMYTEQDFADVKSLGADVIRLPVRMHSMTSGAPDYIIDPLLLRFLDIAVDWAEKYELYIIIDNHSFDPVLATNTDIDKILLPVWAQIANHFKDRSDYVIYEILNEPHGIQDARWGEIQGMAIQTIREYDPKRLIIVGGTDFNSIGKLSSIPVYEDPNLIYTFHFYDPYLFTHQGATWGGPPLLTNLANLPFPANIRRMPRLPPDLRGTWIERSLNYSYSRDAALVTLSAALDRAVAFSIERNVPIFCGEFGVYMINSQQEDRVRWYRYVTSALNNRNISWTSWDYYGGFGLFNSEMGCFNHDLNVEIVRALGFIPPVQIPRNESPMSEGFVIFDDYPNRRYVRVGHWGENTDFSLYDTNSAQGEYAIRWGNVPQYNTFFFHFNNSSRDFSTLVEEGYIFEFKVRTERLVRFDVRFVNRDSPSSIPWRMRYTINENILVPDGNWHTIRIPLADMREHGAWINATQQWLSPKNEFSWKSVYQLEFVSEHMALTGFSIWFDEIKITK
jgi:endoglucanase